MDARPGDWWSLQATSMEHDENYFLDDSPMPLAEAKQRFLGPRHFSDVHYLHLSSYFLAFRRPVVADPGFRWRLDTVVPQEAKGLVVHKYEVGISRYLIDAGFDFDTWLPELQPFHPLYSRHVFDLVGRGFPLAKRNFLGENPRRAPGVGRVARAAPRGRARGPHRGDGGQHRAGDRPDPPARRVRRHPGPGDRTPHGAHLGRSRATPSGGWTARRRRSATGGPSPPDRPAGSTPACARSSMPCATTPACTRSC